VDWPYAGLQSYIATTDKNFIPQSPDTYPIAENLIDFVNELKEKAEKDIWLVGGGQLVTTFINHSLLDRMIITIIPKLIGDGIPLFSKKTAESNWNLVNVQPFDTGVVNLTYDRLHRRKQ
jgi:dihydrofolate reductase